MALLTAEDVLNKAFSKTKYREGFDQDEVDDFLDEVAHTISVLTAERDDLAQRLAAAQASGGAAPMTAPAGQPGSLLEAATDPGQTGGSDMVAVAQKLQDEYVKAGEEERDRIIEDARAKADEMIRRAESDAATRIDQLSHERSSVERKIDDLRRFERDYRARLKTYLENLLGDLDHGSAPSGLPASGPAFPSTGGIAAVAAAGGLEGAVGVGEDTVPYGEEPEPAVQIAEASAPVEEPVAEQDAAPAWSAAMPTLPSEPAAQPVDSFADFAGSPVEPPAPEPQSAVRPEQPAPYQPRMFAAPDEPAGGSETEPESAPAVEEAPAAPARPSLFSAAPQVASPYTPQYTSPEPEQPSPEPEAPAYSEPPRYEAPATQATPLWAPTTAAVPQQTSGASAPSGESGEADEDPAPQSDIYDIRSIFGDVTPRDENR